MTGGTGGLGVVVARHAVQRWGMRDLVLVSPSVVPEAEGIGEVIAELEEAGARVRVAACDVSDRAAVHDLIDGIRSRRRSGRGRGPRCRCPGRRCGDRV
ncbi:KR domain-containing protein [Actinomadura rupiterrae]|uniref:KR domain-containing protein n=1 Tax=Actinomadura rupiterrae TaxID=559627 RepID=UPI003557CD7B